MSRLADIIRFYELLTDLGRKLGGTRRLADCDGRMQWPARGVYFFFEAGEQRTDSGTGPRVVRVGTHALTATSHSTLWNRLVQHRGFVRGSFAGGGNHRGSVFRKHVGYAIARQEQLNVPTWGDGASASHAVRRREHPLECRVSQYLRSMPFLWLDISDASADGRRTRGYLESSSIGLLSNAGKLETAEAIDPPSSLWLGRLCKNEKVVASGLWNSDHVLDECDPGFLGVLEQCIKRV